MILTCFSLNGLAEDAGADSVTGSDFQRVQLATLQPAEHVGRLACGEVGAHPAIFSRVDEVVDTHLWTRVPAHCDVIVPARCHPHHVGRWADD